MKTLLLKRDGAIGDCLLMTPIIKRAVDEGWRVWVQTKCGEVFKNNPYVDKIFDVGRRGGIRTQTGQFKVVDLNFAYEKRPKMHIIDAYSEVVFRDHKTLRWPLYLFNTQRTMQGQFNDPYIVLHAGVGWENRTFSKTFWEHTQNFLGIDFPSYQFIWIGKGDDHACIDYSHAISLIGKLSIHELAYVIDKAKLFIGPDSAPLHIAQTTSTPCIGLFTCARAEYRLTSPHAVAVVPIEPPDLSKSDVASIQPQYRPTLSCYGCLHDEPPPVTYTGCRRGDFICVHERITPEMVMDKVREVLGE